MALSSLVCLRCGHVNRSATASGSAGLACSECEEALWIKCSLGVSSQIALKASRLDAATLVLLIYSQENRHGRMLSSEMSKVSVVMSEEARFARVDVDEHPSAQAMFDVSELPTLMVFANGRELRRHSGVLPQSVLVDWIRQT